MGIAADTNKFVKNAREIDWKSAFNKVNFENLRFVGTGRHPQFKAQPGLKNGAWYTGQVFIMKGYVREIDWLRLADDYKGEAFEGMLSPATEVDHSQATAYCEENGGRLPSYEEISLAYHFAFTKKWQAKVGNFLKPNLALKINGQHSLWTNTVEGAGYLKGDNFRIFTPGANTERYEDNGFESAQLSFLCVKDEIKK